MKHFILPLVFFVNACGFLDQMDVHVINKNDESAAARRESKNSIEATEITGLDPHLIGAKDPAPAVQKVVENGPAVQKYCKKVNRKFLFWGWGKGQCESYQWNHVRNSYLGNPLIWKVFGSEQEHEKENKNTTMIFCGVHGDEITPIKFCFDVIKFLGEQDASEYRDKLVVVAPIVNPDSFFKSRPTRTNYRGVDVNRNFPTKDWRAKALKMWKSHYKGDKRRYPGSRPLSEQETIFQVNLIKRYNPDKIISVHAPLTILDYDGPVMQTATHEHDEKVVDHANKLLTKMSEQAKGYKIKNYPFFPGSLGNYAGNERGVPTYTLELPSSDNRKHKQYWGLFKESIHSAIFHDFRSKNKVAKSNGDNGEQKDDSENF